MPSIAIEKKIVRNGSPGTFTIRIETFQKNSPPSKVSAQIAEGIATPLSLAEFRKTYGVGGDEIEFTDPMVHQKHRISLKPFRNDDPENTFLNFKFEFKPDQPMQVDDLQEHFRRQGIPEEGIAKLLDEIQRQRSSSNP
jgi:hypothetical protein